MRPPLRMGQRYLIEEYVEGREITVGIVNGNALPIVEVRPRSGVYDFASKYTKGMTEYLVPAKLNGDVERAAPEDGPRNMAPVSISRDAQEST